jgi:hypothetical protein
MVRDSLFLLDQPSFIGGMSQVLDLGDTMTGYNESPNGAQADHAALWADWSLIAQDMKVAARRCVAEIGNVAAQQAR